MCALEVSDEGCVCQGVRHTQHASTKHLQLRLCLRLFALITRMHIPSTAAPLLTIPVSFYHIAQHCCDPHSPTSGQSTSADNSQQQPQLSAAQICAGSTLVLPQPPVRQRSAALQQRLAKLQEQLDSQAYAAMVADVTHDEQAAAAARQDPFFPTTKLQLSFGLHVIVTMGTFFALGYYAGHFVLRSQPMVRACV